MDPEIIQKRRIFKAFTIKRIAIGIVSLLIIFSITGFFIAPPLLKWIAVKKLSEKLHREVAIEKIKINPFALTAEIRGFRIKERNGSATFISFDGLYINVKSASVVKWGLIADEIRLSKPYARIVRNDDGTTYNFSDILASFQEKDRTDDKRGFRFSLNNIRILGGTIDFLDSPKKTGHALKNLDLNIPFLSNLPYYVDTYVQPSISGTLNNTMFVFKGKTKPYKDSRETVFEIDVKDFNIPYYLAYVPFPMTFKMTSGFVDAKNSVSYVQYKDMEPTLNIEGTVSFKDIKINDLTGKHLFSLPHADIRIAPSDIFTRKIRFAGLSADSPSVTLVRRSDGKINLLDLMPQEKKQAKGKVKQEEKALKPSFVLNADEIAISSGSVSIADLVPKPSFKTEIEKIDMKVRGFSTEYDKKASIESLSFNLTKKGRFTATGAFSIAPMRAEVKFELKNADIPSFSPYYADKLVILVSSGNVSASGTAFFGFSSGNGLSASYKGKAMVTNFASLDSANTDDFLKWKTLYFGGIDARYQPLSLGVQEISLTDFYSRIIVYEDGTLNVKKIMVQAPSEKSEKPEVPEEKELLKKNASAPAAKKIPIKIGKLTLQGGTINLSDRFIKPNFAANMVEVGGRISGFSSDETSAGKANLRGKFENYAPIEITGTINPLREDMFVDLKVSFTDMDISPVTPYSMKYLGYTIQKGKLSLNLQYLIVKKKLDARNNVFLDQFTLGDSVESPDAPKLPVRLAIALLKNRKGEIELDVPVSGYIDDPEFSIGRIILKILLNILVKAATAPFALLGALFGGGEELSYVEFDYGSSALNDQAVKKLDTIIKALYERPALKMEIEGHVDASNDREGLLQYLFNKKIKSQKLKEMLKQGKPSVQVDEVTIQPDEYQMYLKMAYKEEKFPKPRNIIGIAKDLLGPEMKKLMLTHIEVKESDLRLLAGGRALAIKDYLLKSQKVEQERIFLVEPKTLQPEKKEKVKDSRVDFRLK